MMAGGLIMFGLGSRTGGEIGQGADYIAGILWGSTYPIGSALGVWLDEKE